MPGHGNNNNATEDDVDTGGDALKLLNFLFNDIGPYMFTALVILFMSDHPVFVYLFLLDGTALLGLCLTKMIVYFVKRGFWAMIMSLIGPWGRWLVHRVRDAYRQLRTMWWGKVALQLTVVQLLSAIGYILWYHFDIKLVMRATVEFFKAIPQYLMDTAMLLPVLHRWLRSILIGHGLEYCRKIWYSQMALIEQNPLSGLSAGLFYVIVGITITAGIYFTSMAAREYRAMWLASSEIHQAQPSGRRGHRRPAVAAGETE